MSYKRNIDRRLSPLKLPFLLPQVERMQNMNNNFVEIIPAFRRKPFCDTSSLPYLCMQKIKSHNCVTVKINLTSNQNTKKTI